MSYVANLIVHFDEHREEDGLEEVTAIEKAEPALIHGINSFFERHHERGLVSINAGGKWYGGSKVFEADVLIGAIQALDLNLLLIHLRSIRWRNPENVQVILKDQLDRKFKVLDVFGQKHGAA